MELRPNDLVLCSGTLKPADLETTARAAAAAGFAGVSLYHHEIVTARARGWGDASICALLGDLGLALAEVDGRMSWLPGDRDAPGVQEMVDTAAAVGARSLTVLEVDGRRPGVDLPVGVFAEHFAALCDVAAGAGLLAHIEYFPRSGICDLATAQAIVAAAGRANGGVMMDTWHHVRGPDAGRTDLAAVAPSIIALQVGDVLPVPGPDLGVEMMHRRLLPGDGGADLAGLLRALRHHGCTAPVEVEVYADDLHALDPFDAARRAAGAIGRVLDAAGLLV